jgi:hypothetical protein
MVRAIALSLALLIGLGTVIPFATEYAEAGPKKVRKYGKHKRYKKYSKRWWRQYHARQKRLKALRARRRALRLRRLRLARAHSPRLAKPVPAKAAKPAEEQAAVLPTGEAAPRGWKRGASSGGELQFRIDNGGGDVGSAAISVVGPATGETNFTGRNRMIGGVQTVSLRREVINRMIRENGWVVNDYQKEIGGKNVYVVVAQSQGPAGRLNSRMFYFAEADGRIYSVATNIGVDSSPRLAEETEKVIFSLQNRVRPAQQARVNE